MAGTTRELELVGGPWAARDGRRAAARHGALARTPRALSFRDALSWGCMRRGPGPGPAPPADDVRQVDLSLITRERVRMAIYGISHIRRFFLFSRYIYIF